MLPYPLPSPTHPNATYTSPDLSESKARQRNSRACDQCRKLRTKCVKQASPGPCCNCVRRDLECTAEGPDHKRGPPRGYLHALEDRLQGAEALLGVLISLPDPNIQRLLATLSIDHQASEILSRVDHSAFGPSGRKLRSWLIDAVTSSDSQAEFKRNTRLGLANDTADPLVTSKTNLWQDQLIQLVNKPNISSQTSLVEPQITFPFASQPSHSAYASSISETQPSPEYYSSSGSDEMKIPPYHPPFY